MKEITPPYFTDCIKELNILQTFFSLFRIYASTLYIFRISCVPRWNRLINLTRTFISRKPGCIKWEMRLQSKKNRINGELQLKHLLKHVWYVVIQPKHEFSIKHEALKRQGLKFKSCNNILYIISYFFYTLKTFPSISAFVYPTRAL